MHAYTCMHAHAHTHAHAHAHIHITLYGSKCLTGENFDESDKSKFHR